MISISDIKSVWDSILNRPVIKIELKDLSFDNFPTAPYFDLEIEVTNIGNKPTNITNFKMSEEKDMKPNIMLHHEEFPISLDIGKTKKLNIWFQFKEVPKWDRKNFKFYLMTPFGKVKKKFCFDKNIVRQTKRGDVSLTII